MTPDEQAVWDAMRAVYAGFLASDAAGVDALLDPDVTIWDSEEMAMTHGLAELAQLRDRRPDEGATAEVAGADDSASASASAPTVVDLDARDPVIDVWGDVALLRHLLHVRMSDGSEQVVRNTSVWRRSPGSAAGWLAVHNHEDVIA